METTVFSRVTVLVRGGGDLGSGVVYRLYRAGFPVVVSELPKPLFVRRKVAYGAAVYEQAVTVDDVTARLASLSEVGLLLRQGVVPVVIEPWHTVVKSLQPVVIVDARMAKAPLDCDIQQSPLVVALGPGLEAGIHCHAVIETNRGHSLGRVFWDGHAAPDTGTPGSVGGLSSARVLRAPAAGRVLPHCEIGDLVHAGDIVAEVGGQSVQAQISGVVRGLIHPSVEVCQGLKIGDVDPRMEREHCFTISEKALAIGGGALEAILSDGIIRQRLRECVSD